MAEIQRTRPTTTAEPPTEWMSRIDGCPECVDNTEAPQSVEDTGGGGFNARYRCADCGHRWETAWWDAPFAGGGV